MLTVGLTRHEIMSFIMIIVLINQ